jgi:hypothetical protein
MNLTSKNIISRIASKTSKFNNAIRATGQPFHLVDPSPWPFLSALAILNLLI